MEEEDTARARPRSATTKSFWAFNSMLSGLMSLCREGARVSEQQQVQRGVSSDRHIPMDNVVTMEVGEPQRSLNGILHARSPGDRVATVKQLS